MAARREHALLIPASDPSRAGYRAAITVSRAAQELRPHGVSVAVTRVRARDLRNPRVKEAMSRRGVTGLPALLADGGRPVVGVAAIAAYYKTLAGALAKRAPRGQPATARAPVRRDTFGTSWDESLQTRDLDDAVQRHSQMRSRGPAPGRGGRGEQGTEGGRRAREQQPPPAARPAAATPAPARAGGNRDDSVELEASADVGDVDLDDYFRQAIQTGGAEEDLAES